ncbi:MFS transporter [Diaminobutyricibacter sp. McL0618]|uniref:MFS transporter n=1 Tax=Leifsonia sp. McL0618 TaxID=3415677 RepID=UPI003CFAAC3C
MTQTLQQPAATGVGTPARRRITHGAGFWVVAGTFLVAMAFSVVPTPLWTLYQARDAFSTFAITLAFAAYAVGVLVSLFLVGHLSDRVGRRTILLPAIALELVAAVLFIVWNTLPGLIVARVVSGLGIGMITATATAFIFELHARAHPGSDRTRSDVVSTAANLGGLGLGAIVAGILAQFVAQPLVTPFVVFLVLLALAAVGVALVPETVAGSGERVAYRPQRIRVPRNARMRYFAAAVVAFGAFSFFALATALAPAFVAGDLKVASQAVGGLVVFLAFASAVGTQLVMRSVRQSVQVAIGVVMMVLGLVALTAGVWSASLALFIVGGVLAGGGAGVLFKTALLVGSKLAEPRFRGEALAGIFLISYAGLIVPVVGIGIATLFLPIATALLAFAALIALVVIIGGITVIRGL